MPRSFSYRLRLPAPRHRWLLPVLPLAGLSVWCIFYLCHDYEALAAWMRSLGPDMPHALNWQQDYFSPATWRQGRWLAGFGAPGCGALAAYCLWQWRRGGAGMSSLIFSRRDAVCILLLMLIAAGGWCWGQLLLSPGPDELYSARYCGAAHPLRTAAYYMDPNNHVLFNLLNRLLFFSGSDKLFTGRVLSGIAYLLLLPLLYRFASRYVRNKWAAFLMALLLGLQFQVVCFASLARGYLLYLLLQWLAAAAFCRYWEGSRRSKNDLLVYALAGAGAFWVLPTYLYLFATLSIAALLVQLRRRRLDGAFWTYTALTLAFTAAAYLPVLLFSGAGAVSGNKFVVAQPGLLQGLGKHVTMVLQEGFWLTYPRLTWWPLALLLLPLAGLPLLRRSGAGVPLLLYLLAWPIYIMMALSMQHFAFLRNLIFQESLTLFIFLLLLYRASRWLAAHPRFQNSKRKGTAAGALFLLPAAALAVHFIFFFVNNADALYSVSTRWHNEEIQDRIRRLPPGTTIAAPDFAISWQYLGQRAGYPVTVRAAGVPGPESVLVTHYTDEPGPIQIPGYARIREFLFYRIYLKQPVDTVLLRVVEGF